MIHEFKNGMTVRKLKKLVKDWPEEDDIGDPTKVWIETGWCKSSPVTVVSTLNRKVDQETGKEWSDMIFESNVFTYRITK